MGRQVQEYVRGGKRMAEDLSRYAARLPDRMSGDEASMKRNGELRNGCVDVVC